MKTNSGEGILSRWAWKVDFQGVGGMVRWDVVVDMVERRERRRGRMVRVRGAMVLLSMGDAEGGLMGGS